MPVAWEPAWMLLLIALLRGVTEFLDYKGNREKKKVQGQVSKSQLENYALLLLLLLLRSCSFYSLIKKIMLFDSETHDHSSTRRSCKGLNRRVPECNRWSPPPACQTQKKKRSLGHNRLFTLFSYFSQASSKFLTNSSLSWQQPQASALYVAPHD